jgi:IclR family transcriptional regulator, KDG regulon repressor
LDYIDTIANKLRIYYIRKNRDIFLLCYRKVGYFMDYEKNGLIVNSVVNAVGILNYLAKDINGRTFTEVSKDLDLHKTTTHRFLQTLLKTDMIKLDPLTGRYTLGLKLIELGTTSQSQLHLIQEMKPFLRELMEQIGETSNLAVYDEKGAIFVDSVESTKGIRAFSRLGRHACYYSTSLGKVILAFLPEEEASKYISLIEFTQYTPRTITDPNRLKEELVKIRVQGYASDDEEAEIGSRCIAAPIFNYTGKVIAAISVSGPSERILINRIEPAAQIVMEVAHRASMTLGYRQGDLVTKR